MKRKSNHIYLPNELITEILLRLPVKPLGRFKCVCRTWYHLIQNPNFIKNHYHHPRNPTRLFVAVPKRVSRRPFDEYEFKLFSGEPLSLQQDIRNPINSSGRELLQNILGPVNGLYFLSYCSSNQNYTNHVFHLALWNPATYQFRKLPSLPSSLEYRGKLLPNRYLGFGFAGNDIKVVSINSTYDGLNKTVKISLYSLNNDSWKGIQHDSARLIARGTIPPCKNTFSHLNGVYYWLTNDNLLLFDMNSEEFREVNLPNLISDMDCLECICVRDNSSIVLFVKHYKDSSSWFPGKAFESVDLWEYKEDEEWFKLLSFDRWSTFALLDPCLYGFRRKDEMLIKRKDNKKVVLFNMNSHEIQDLENVRSTITQLFPLSYKESLTSV